MTNEILQYKLTKQYKGYYELYNKLSRPIEDKQPTRVVEGLARWSEPEVGLVDISNMNLTLEDLD